MDEEPTTMALRGPSSLHGHADSSSGPNDIELARQRARQRRLGRLAVAVGAFAAFLVARDLIGVTLFLSGAKAAGHLAFSWPFSVLHLPPGSAKYIPSAVLIGALLLIIAVPLVGAGRSPHVLYRPEEIGIGFDDVVGAGAVVDEVRRTLDLFLANRSFAERTGGSARRAVLFEGPPGTGKTYLAKAIAAEAGVPFLYVSSSAFQSMFYGQTNRKVRSYFKALRRYARAEGGAIGFIEEIDAIGTSRAGMRASGGEGVAGVVNELLVQMQSFDHISGTERALGALVDAANRWLPPQRHLRRPAHEVPNVLVVAATNRAADLDPALVRPGRFDRTITIDLPDRAGRREIIDYYLARKSHEAALDDPLARDDLAAATAGYSPVMIEHLLDEALVAAMRRGAERFGPADLASARLTEELGLVSPATYTPDELARIATHEAGHATVAWAVAPERSLEVLSVRKRRSSLGLLAHSEIEERHTATAGELGHLLVIAMGGMAAEEAFFGSASNGVAGDLAAATRIGAAMIGSFGMGGSLISLDAAHMPNADIVARVLADDASREALDHLLDQAKADAAEAIGAHRAVVEALRDALVEHGELVGTEIAAVVEGVALSRSGVRS